MRTNSLTEELLINHLETKLQFQKSLKTISLKLNRKMTEFTKAVLVWRFLKNDDFIDFKFKVWDVMCQINGYFFDFE